MPANPDTRGELQTYFLEHGFAELVEQSREVAPSVNQMQVGAAYRPELDDLYSLHRFIIEKKRTTVLEFGVGWSSAVMAHALLLNKEKYNISHLRRNNPFEIHSIDDVQQWIDVARERCSAYPNAHFYFSDVDMCLWNGRVATEYRTLPLINPDFIYLDGPDQFDVKGDVNGMSTRHKDMMPMACDILKMENFLTPGTIIVVDGRTANARFLQRNLEREWTYDYENDQHVFALVEEPLGKHSKNQLAFYAS